MAYSYWTLLKSLLEPKVFLLDIFTESLLPLIEMVWYEFVKLLFLYGSLCFFLP